MSFLYITTRAPKVVLRRINLYSALRAPSAHISSDSTSSRPRSLTSRGRTAGRGGQAKREAAPSWNLIRNPQRQAKLRAGLPERGSRVRAHFLRTQRCCQAAAHPSWPAQAQVCATPPSPSPEPSRIVARRVRPSNGAGVMRAPWLRRRTTLSLEKEVV